MYSALESMLEVLLAGYTTDVGHAHKLLHACAWSQSLIHLNSLVLESFADSKLLDYSDPGQLTLRINRTLGVSRYIWHRPNNCTNARGLQRRGQGTYG